MRYRRLNDSIEARIGPPLGYEQRVPIVGLADIKAHLCTCDGRLKAHDPSCNLTGVRVKPGLE